MGSIGIFLSQEKWHQLGAKKYSSGLEELVRAVEFLNLPVLYFSLPQDRLDEGMLLATPLEQRVFKVDYYPFPQVIYDLGVFPMKDRAEAKKVRNALICYNAHFVNTRSAFSKWTTYSLLSTDPQIAPYLPKTVKFKGVDTLSQMLSEYSLVCVKSIWGSRGIEVLFIEKRGIYFFLFYPDDYNERFSDLDELAKAISSFMKGDKWIIQQTIDLMTWRNRCFDLRVLVQKVTLQRWECTEICLRMAQQGRRITSTSQGGKVVEAASVLSALWPSRYLEINNEVKELTLKIAQALENHKGPLCELGMDVGIDRYGRIWLFEVNGKPGKVTVRKLRNKHTIRLAYERPLSYAALRLEEK
jgi:glutathione synthase/RimK-type ligase-like ATP-grasp enzyme